MARRYSSVRASWLVLLVLLVPPLYGQTCPTSPDPCLVNQRTGCNCVVRPGPAGVACDLPGGGDGWCISGVCEVNLCAFADCDDSNDCTFDYCDPLSGECTNDPAPGLHPACVDQATGVPGACFGTVCVAGDACLLAGAGRINCCSDCSGSTANYATTCDPQDVLPDGSSCDPTGAEAPGSGQAGQCQGGVCVWSSGPCAGVICPDEGFDCTKDWCDPATYLTEGCRRDPVELAPSCNGSINTACIGGICKTQDFCVTAGVGAQNCCPSEFCDDATTCSYPAAFEGYHCDPLGGYSPSSVFSENRPGFCNANAECLWPLCAVDDPNDPGHLIELDCDDGNDCTDDACDPATGACTHSGIPGYPSCDNGNGICFGWACQAIPDSVPKCKTHLDCDDGNDCTEDTCDFGAGTCSNQPRNNGFPCTLPGGYPGKCAFGICKP